MSRLALDWTGTVVDDAAAACHALGAVLGPRICRPETVQASGREAFPPATDS